MTRFVETRYWIRYRWAKALWRPRIWLRAAWLSGAALCVGRDDRLVLVLDPDQFPPEEIEGLLGALEWSGLSKRCIVIVGEGVRAAVVSEGTSPLAEEVPDGPA